MFDWLLNVFRDKDEDDFRRQVKAQEDYEKIEQKRRIDQQSDRAESIKPLAFAPGIQDYLDEHPDVQNLLQNSMLAGNFDNSLLEHPVEFARRLHVAKQALDLDMDGQFISSNAFSTPENALKLRNAVAQQQAETPRTMANDDFLREMTPPQTLGMVRKPELALA